MASDESFRTPLSSTVDLMTLSPRRTVLDDPHLPSDYLTDGEFDSICDVTMREVHDDNLFNATSLDYLDKCTESKKNQTLIDRGKDSLFVKFDPLYAKTLLAHCAPPESVADLSENDIGYETASNNSIVNDGAAHSRYTSSAGSLTSKCANDKPTQMVSPVVIADTPKVILGPPAPTPALVRSVSAILTPTQVGPERLINIFGNTPPTAAPRSPRFKYDNTFASQDFNHVQSLRVVLQKQDQELSFLRRENKELKYTLQKTKEEMGIQINKLEGQVESLTQKECKLVQQVSDKTLSNKQMAIVMEEYEKTISQLIDDQEKLSAEKDEALRHLTSMESSFNDLLTKYEKCKVVINTFKDDQKLLLQKITEYEAGMKKYENSYNALKQATTDSLNKANETLEQMNKTHNLEITKLNANIKKHEITVSSLQETLTQKNRNIEELTRICDQLINSN
ncbi:uncharacterized protein LOC112047206 [Bicyclus anynana]|uniref:Uncharacterized protein LOC112047206 n=1 Tax=Bicyclus anynana TaxID=110368 RepID=A0A6J1NAE6_BICAN|nr:uncharacterized protein LOC112047206 [Bicyclus anynana]